MITLAVYHSQIRKEEKLIAAAARRQNVRLQLVDIRREIFNPKAFQCGYDVALERSVSTVKGTYATAFLESMGVPVVNTLKVSQICLDKFSSSLTLSRANVPCARFVLVFNLEQALAALEELGGFPVVIKPPQGSWGRLLAKVNDRDGLEAILEHKEVLGTPPHKAYYLQEYIRKPGFDIRVFVVAHKSICAIYRESDHWITNTARGAVTKNCALNREIRDICGRVSEAVGGGLLAIDLFQTDTGYVVNEVNHTMEFRNSEEPTGVSISDAIVGYCVQVAKMRQAA